MIKVVETKPFEGQKPGTSGLRKPVQTFQQPGYLENFIQSILDVSLADVKNRNAVQLVVGGDGRYYSSQAIQTIISMCAANEVGHLIVAHNGIMSTPAISAVIRARNAHGGIILTASHNPGGINGDFGVKYNCANGGPAPDQVTNEIYARSKQIKQYKRLDPSMPDVDVGRIGQHVVKHSGGEMMVDVVDSVDMYLNLLKAIFDFELLRKFVSSKRLLIDAMNGVMGPYVRRIIVQELGASADAAIRCDPLPDFGGHHPDPNLTYAADLVDKMRNGPYDLGAAFDGDGDRNMILGAKGFFVTPSDSLAVLGENLERIPYFRRDRVKGYARSMPTSRAMDQVAKKTGLKCYETPTGWKYFGSLLDAGLVSICGEESFGTGSDHIREKDGLWAVLAWLSVMATMPDDQSNSVESIVRQHWRTYGRCYYCRYDYENCDARSCETMMSTLAAKIAANQLPKTIELDGTTYHVDEAFNFGYTDPVSGEQASNQGLVIQFNGGASRVMFRLSGTGSTGATVRLYIEQMEMDSEKAINGNQEDYIRPLAKVALQLSCLSEFTGRQQPTVIT
ncbi:phosphoglucose mutase 1 [Dermatophagoides farinae]|uniref:phosphoglucose mutase 1 n=1 Tax=Dermatophagoides farinae TaxID=6954 RepID=UPI003F5F7850